MQQLPGDIQSENLNGTSVVASTPTSTQGSSPGGGAVDTKSNVSSFIPSNINSTLSQIQNPSTFGEQLVNQAKQKVIGVVLGPIQKLKDEIEKTINAKIKLETKHVKTVLDLTNKSLPTTTYDSFGTQIVTPPLLTPDEYQAAIDKENASYDAAKTIVDNNLATLNDRLQKILLDPYNKIKADFTKAKVDIATSKTRIKALKAQMDAQKLKQLSLNIAKGIAVTTSALLTQQLIQVITDNSSLQDLVNKTNDIIDSAVTIDQLNQARIARNGAISKINQQEVRIQAAIKVLNTINIILTVFNVLTRVLDILNIPSPFGVAAKPLAGLYIKARLVLDAISSAVCILIPILEAAVFVLEDLKNQLHDINSKLEAKTLALLNDVDLANYLSNILNSSSNSLCNTARLPDETDEDYYNRLRSDVCIRDLLASQNPTANLSDLSNNALFNLASQITPPTNNFGTYRGFTFSIKEEDNSNFVVRGFKRHYAVAINTRGVEQVKSDFSFTLDPQQLVNQLKFIIDQQNLQG
jgi:hypothetical protein